MGEFRIGDCWLGIRKGPRVKRRELWALFFKTIKNECCVRGGWINGKWKELDVFMVRRLFIRNTQILSMLELMFQFVKEERTEGQGVIKVRKL